MRKKRIDECTHQEEADNLGLDHRRIPSQYCRASGELKDAGRFDAMAVERETLGMYDRNSL